MSDYRVKVSVRNARILRAIEEAGYRSVAEFCRTEELDLTSTYMLIGLRAAPIGKSGDFSPTARKLMDALCKLPQELWTTEQLNMELPKSTYERDVSEEDAFTSLARDETIRRLLASAGLTPRQEQILSDRFGRDLTLQEAADGIDRTRELARRVEQRALLKMTWAAAREKIEDPQE